MLTKDTPVSTTLVAVTRVKDETHERVDHSHLWTFDCLRRRDWIEYNNSGKRGSNPCKHLKLNDHPSVNADSFPLFYGYAITHVPNSADPVHVYVSKVETSVPFPAWIRYTDTTVLPEFQLRWNENFKWDHWSYRAFSTMKPKIPEAVSLLNFLNELKDFKSLIQFYRKMIDNWKRIVNSGTSKSKKRAILRDTFSSKTASEIHLQYGLGLRPFVNDVLSMFELMNTFRKRFVDFFTRMGTLQIRHWHQDLSLADRRVLSGPIVTHGGTIVPPEAWSVVYEIDRSSWSFTQDHVTPLVTSCRYSATMIYIYECPQLAQRYKTLLVVLDSLGVNWDPSILWEAVPFSFVIDWFINVGDWMESNYQKTALPIRVNIVDFCHSLKIGWKYKGLLEVPLASTVGQNEHGEFYIPNDAAPLPPFAVERNGSYYIRRVETPRMTSPLQEGPGLDLSKFLTSMSLANTRRRPKTSAP